MDNRAEICLSSDTEDECEKDKLSSGRKANFKQETISLLSDSEEDSIKSSDSDYVCYVKTTKPDNIFKSARPESKRNAVFMSNKKHKPDHSLRISDWSYFSWIYQSLCTWVYSNKNYSRLLVCELYLT